MPILRTSTEQPRTADPATRRAALTLLGLLGLQVLLALSSLWTAQSGTPQGLRIAVVATTRQAGEAAATRLRTAGGGVLATVVTPDVTTARRALRDRSADAAFLAGPATTDELIVATAAGPSGSAQLVTRFQAFEKARSRTLKLADAVPLPREDRRGTAASYITLVMVVGGYLAATVLAPMLAPGTRRRRLLALLTVYAGASALTVVVAGRVALGVLRGHEGAATGAAALTCFAAAVAVTAGRAALGQLITGGLALLLVVGSNLTAGVLTPYAFQPQPYRAVGPYLLTGAGADLLRDLSYFDLRSAGRPLLVVATWSLLGTAALVLSARRRPEAVVPARRVPVLDPRERRPARAVDTVHARLLVQPRVLASWRRRPATAARDDGLRGVG